MELDYVAGLFDGEGSGVFTLSLCNQKGRKCVRFYAWIVINLSHEEGRTLLAKVEDCLAQYEIKSFHYPVDINHSGKSYGVATTWKIANQESILKFIELMKGKVILKAWRLETLEKIIKTHQSQRFKNRQYSKEHYSHYRELAAMWDNAYVPSGKSRREISMVQKLDNIWEKLALPK